MSDFSAIHRITDVTQLSGPAFFMLAWRLPAYQGVMAARARMRAAEERDTAPVPVTRQQTEPRRKVQHVPATRAALKADRTMSGLISFNT